MKKLKILVPVIIFLLILLGCTTKVNASAPTITNAYDLTNWIAYFGGSGSVTRDGNTVKLQKDISANENMYLYTTGGNDLVLDLNGHSIDFDVSITNGAIWGTTIANFTITDTSGKDTDFIRTNKGPVIYNSASYNTFTVENTELVCYNTNLEPTYKSYATNTNIFNNVKLTSYDSGIAAAGSGKYILNNVNFNLGSSSVSKYGVKVWGHNDVTLNNCTYKSAAGDGKAVWLAGGDDGKVTINGGSYTYDKAGNSYLLLVDKGTLEINGGDFSSKSMATVRGTNGKIIINDGNFYGIKNALLIASDCSLSLRGGTFKADTWGAVAFGSTKKIYNIIPVGYFATNDTVQKNTTTQYNETVKEFKVLATPQDINLSKEKFTYNKKVQKPTITVKDSEGKVIPESNYSVNYTGGCKKVGTYFVYVTFTGDYAPIGQVELTYQIVPKGTKLSKVTAGKKKFTAKWKKQTTETTGYQVQYSTKKDFSSGNKTINVKKNKTTSTSAKKLKAKKKYYVRVRTYKTVNGKKYYSSWSASKTVKTKK